jgi:hypothetical protein
MSPSSDLQLNDSANHARFFELCALHSTGSLRRDELAELNKHVGICPECRGLLADYHSLVGFSIPLLAEESGVEPATGFDRQLAQRKRLLLQSVKHNSAEETESWANTAWSTLWFLGVPAVKYVGVVILAVCVALGGYVLGGRMSGSSAPMQALPNQAQVELEIQRAEASRERDSLRTLIERRQQELKKASLEKQEQLSEISKSRQLLDEATAAASQDASALASLTHENASLKADHDGMSRGLQDAQLNLSQIKEQLHQLQVERTGLQAESATKDAQIEELTAQISEQQRLLAADRDIRELMGARDLLISDVLDIDTKGRSKKPFGRIFYTKNKSLVFYAFDLEKQHGLRNASTFQAWGARATDKGSEYPVSMGIFYVDNESARRWVLKLDNPKILEQVDSVFVTVEPEGGSHKPSGKQLLFTYLRGEANHP